MLRRTRDSGLRFGHAGHSRSGGKSAPCLALQFSTGVHSKPKTNEDTLKSVTGPLITRLTKSFSLLARIEVAKFGIEPAYQLRSQRVIFVRHVFTYSPRILLFLYPSQSLHPAPTAKAMGHPGQGDFYGGLRNRFRKTSRFPNSASTRTCPPTDRMTAKSAPVGAVALTGMLVLGFRGRFWRFAPV